MRFITLFTTIVVYTFTSLSLLVNISKGSTEYLDSNDAPVKLNNKLMGLLGGLAMGGLIGSSVASRPNHYGGGDSHRGENSKRIEYTTGGRYSGYVSGPPPASGVQYYGIQNCRGNCGNYYLPGYYNAGEYRGGYFPGGYFAGGFLLGRATTESDNSGNVTIIPYTDAASLCNPNWFPLYNIILFCIGLGLVF